MWWVRLTGHSKDSNNVKADLCFVWRQSSILRSMKHKAGFACKKTTLLLAYPKFCTDSCCIFWAEVLLILSTNDEKPESPRVATATYPLGNQLSSSIATNRFRTDPSVHRHIKEALLDVVGGQTVPERGEGLTTAPPPSTYNGAHQVLGTFDTWKRLRHLTQKLSSYH